MTHVTIQPQTIAAAAADVAGIGSAINEANAAAAGRITGMVAAAADEVSAAMTTLFNAYGHEYRAVFNQAAAFHAEFTRTLSGAWNAYTQAEAANAAAATNVTLVMGGSGLPIPPKSYVDAVVQKYVTPHFPGFGVNDARGLFTPESFYPLTGIKDLVPNVSVSEGVAILEGAIRDQLAAGNNVAVLGFSQSSIISSLVMQALAPGNTPSSLPIVFTLLGNPMNPNGGLLARFPDLIMPSVGFTFYGATPDNSFTTHIYTIEYDGFADFPQYPINLLADLNAIAGIYYVHGTYADLTPQQLASAIPLTNTEGPTMTSYYMIPNPHLPILQPVRHIPIVGNALAALIEPDMRVLVNLGYGSPDQGWSTGPPNVPTSFGLIPRVDPVVVLDRLAAGTQQGINDFWSEIGIQASSVSLPGLVDGLSSMQPPTFGPVPPPNTVVETLANAISTGYSVLLPTADFTTAAVLSIPAYDVQLFMNGIAQVLHGDPYGLVRAIGDPIAADVALFAIAAGFEAIVLANATDSILADLRSL